MHPSQTDHGHDSDQATAWWLLRTQQASLTAVMDRELENRHGFGVDWFDVLTAVSRAGGKLRMRDLADAIVRDRSTCTRLVARLEVANLIVRDADPVDGRGVVATMTEEGRRRLSDASVTHARLVDQHFSRHLSDRLARTLILALNRMSAADTALPN